MTLGETQSEEGIQPKNQRNEKTAPLKVTQLNTHHNGENMDNGNLDKSHGNTKHLKQVKQISFN